MSDLVRQPLMSTGLAPTAAGCAAKTMMTIIITPTSEAGRTRAS